MSNFETDKSYSWEIPTSAESPMVVPISVVDVWEDISNEAQLLEVNRYDFASTCAGLACQMAKLKPGEQFTMRDRAGFTKQFHIADDLFKPPVHNFQIGEPKREVSWNIASKQRDLFMEACNANKITLEEYGLRSLVMGLWVSKAIREEGVSLYYPEGGIDKEYSFAVANPRKRIKKYFASQ